LITNACLHGKLLRHAISIRTGSMNGEKPGLSAKRYSCSFQETWSVQIEKSKGMFEKQLQSDFMVFPDNQN